MNVVVDEPQGSSNSIPSVWEVTNSKLALIRLHGCNHETWNIQGVKAASDRFNYDYTEEELAEIAAHVIELTRSVDLTHVVLNNNFEDQGQRNARTLMDIIGDNGGVVTRTNVN